MLPPLAPRLLDMHLRRYTKTATMELRTDVSVDAISVAEDMRTQMLQPGALEFGLVANHTRHVNPALIANLFGTLENSLAEELKNTPLVLIMLTKMFVVHRNPVVLTPGYQILESLMFGYLTRESLMFGYLIRESQIPVLLIHESPILASPTHEFRTHVLLIHVSLTHVSLTHASRTHEFLTLDLLILVFRTLELLGNVMLSLTGNLNSTLR